MTKISYTELDLYVPTTEDFNYFKDFYTNVLKSTFSSINFNYGHFVAACLNYQIQKKCSWQEFNSINRECARDQLLFDLGFEPIGYIFSPVHYEVGIEHLTKES